ncbi:MAG: LysM peptidoglycan-binding domain-containing protein [Chitinispirillaceae bacterium]
MVAPEIDSSEILAEEEDLEEETGNIDELLKKAKLACRNEKYADADTLLNKAVLILENRLEHAEAEWFPLQEYIDEIISIYNDSMPVVFTVPDEISVIAFKQQIIESLDTLEISPHDSIFFYRLSKKRGIAYDMPIVWNDRVKKSLLFYLKSRKGIFDRWLLRAGYYLPTFKKMFREAGLPGDLAYLPILESGFNPHAYSHAHAAGIWQFIPSTGRIFGLRQNYWIDERRDPYKSTQAAINYFKKLYNDFNDWHLALGSYNCGEGRMRRTMLRDSTEDYWSLSLPKETMNYVPLYLASLIVAKNPDVLDFSFQTDTVFDPDTVFINDCIELSTIAKGIDVPLDTLKKINPHILHWCTPPDLENVQLYLPKGYAAPFKKFYSELPDEKKVKFYRYRISPGDNLLQIARKFGVPVSGLRTINNLRTNRIIAGRYLFIPIPVNTSAPKTIASESSQNKSTKQETKSVNKGKKISYRVRKGDTAWKISEIFSVTVKDILRWNNLSSAKQLKANQIIYLYSAEATTASTQAPPAADGSEKYSGKYLVKKGDNLYTIAQNLGLSVDELANVNRLNPRRPLIFPGDILVYDKSKVKKTTTKKETTKRSTIKDEPKDVISYTVGQGDNLFRISQKFSVDLDELMALNNITANSVLHVGDQIKLPTGSKSVPRAPSPSNRIPENAGIYTVQKGDNLWSIASNQGAPLDSIYKYNNLTPDSKLMPGDTILILRGE